MKIVHMSLGNERGGSTGVMLQLAQGATAKGHAVTVMVFRNDVVAERARARGLDVLVAGGNRLQSIWRMYQLLKQHKPEIVHTHSYFPDVFGRPAARLARVPVIVSTAHTNLRGAAGLSGGGIPGRRLIVPMLSRWTNWASDYFYATSSDVSRFLQAEGVADSRIRLLLNEIDTLPFKNQTANERGALRAELGFSDSDIVLGATGRLEDVKRFDRLIEALKRLRSRLPNLKLILIGEGSARHALEACIRQYNLESQVLLTGWRSDVSRILPAIDIYAVVSRMEGTPLSLLEAMAAGNACIAVRVGGLPDLIPTPQVGRIIEPENDLELDNAITELATQQELRYKIGQNARNHVFTTHNTLHEQNLSAVLSDYKRLLAAKVSP
jgi:glycosyltransferase involved in cell wall biosynthesis